MTASEQCSDDMGGEVDVETDEPIWCNECGHGWPCATVRALSPHPSERPAVNRAAEGASTREGEGVEGAGGEAAAIGFFNPPDPVAADAPVDDVATPSAAPHRLNRSQESGTRSRVPATPTAPLPDQGQQRGEGVPTCYAQTHRKGPGWMSVCGQVSNIIAVDDLAVVTCGVCRRS